MRPGLVSLGRSVGDGSFGNSKTMWIFVMA